MRLPAGGVPAGRAWKPRVGFLHSFVNPAHERRARRSWARPGRSCRSRSPRRSRRRCGNGNASPPPPPTPMSSPGWRTTCTGWKRGSRVGLGCPLFLMLSGGGLTTLDTAARFPIRLVESGPAGGAIFAAHVARQRGWAGCSPSTWAAPPRRSAWWTASAAGRAHLRGRPRRPLQEGIRPAAAHPGDRDGGDRRRQRVPRPSRRMDASRWDPKAPAPIPGRPATGAAGRSRR